MRQLADMRMKAVAAKKDGGAWVPDGILESSYQPWKGDLQMPFTINTYVNTDNVPVLVAIFSLVILILEL